MTARWRDDFRHAQLIGSRLAFSTFEIVVHHHRDHPASQWMYSCYKFGADTLEIGDDRTSLGEAKQLAVSALRSKLAHAVSELTQVKP